MKVLFLAQAFPPHPEVGARRVRNLVDALLAAGHEVTMITERVPGVDYEIAGTAEPGLRIVPVDVGIPFGRRLHYLKRRAMGAEPGAVAAPGKYPLPKAGFFRQAALSLLSLPDTDQHIIGPFLRCGMRALGAGADLIYTSAPPFSIQIVGYLLRRRTGIRWVSEYRDPWNQPWSDREVLENGLLRKIDALLERRVLRKADAIVTVTDSARELIAGKLPAASQTRVLVARNGIPSWEKADPKPKPASSRSGPFTLLHAGSLYLNRDPVCFLDGLARFVASAKLGPADLRVDLIGRCREYQGRSVAGLIEERGLGGIIHIEDWLPHARVRARILAADALLLFAQHQPLQIPNKLYEYLASGIPILAFVDRDGESARLLNEIGHAEMLYETDPDAVATALGRLYAGRFIPPAGCEKERLAARAHFGTKAQMTGLVAELTARFGP